MSYCPECGEKIAKEDIFCPFCGISIKPVAPVDDASMSETIVDMPPPVVINKEALDALTAKGGAATPKTETQNEPPAEKQEVSESFSKPENPSPFSAGNTSENWAMKTESVEIPAENLEDLRSIPLASPFGSDEPAPAKDIALPAHGTPPSPFSVDEPLPPPTEKSDDSGHISDVPPPIIQEEKPFNPFEATPVN